MQTVFVSVVVFDAEDLRISISSSEDALRLDLIEFHNDNAPEWDVPTLPQDTPLDVVKSAIRDFDWHVVVEENCVWEPKLAA